MDEAIALCRVSTKAQYEEGNTEPQLIRIRRAANILDCNIIEVWDIYTSSRKGKNIERKDLREMYAFCKRHKKVRYLIVDEPDRFMRSIEEYYYWKVKFKMLKVQIRLAKRPEIDPDEDSAIFDELIDVYRAEQSNKERITKTPANQKERIKLGYYPGNPPAGYIKGTLSGLPEPDPVRFPLIKANLLLVLSRRYTIQESLKHLNDSGYTTRDFGPRATGGQPIDMYRYKRLICNAFYAGIIKFGNCDFIQEKGLHERMITPEQHYQIVDIVHGIQPKYVKRVNNPLFPLNNVLECYRCQAESNKKQVMVGYHNSNGTKRRSTKEYDRYRCRTCNKSILREVLHNAVTEYFESITLPASHFTQLRKSLRKAWQHTEQSKIEELNSKRALLNDLNKKKYNLISAMAANIDMSDDFREAIDSVKAQIAKCQLEIEESSDIEHDFLEFCDFAFNYVQSLGEKWQTLDKLELQRCKQMLFPAGFGINKNNKVCTPEISIIFRGEANKIAPEGADFTNMEGPMYRYCNQAYR